MSTEVIHTPSQSDKVLAKRKQTTSVILRQMVLMSALHYNYGYRFVVSKAQKKSTKTLCYFPIEKIIDADGQLVYDSETIGIGAPNRNRYCQNYVIEFMREVMGRLGYMFKLRPTNHSKKLIGDNKVVTLNKIVDYSFSGSDGILYTFSMEDLEKTLGENFHAYLTQVFDLGYEKFIIGSSGDCFDFVESCLKTVKPHSVSVFKQYDLLFYTAIELSHCYCPTTVACSCINSTNEIHSTEKSNGLTSSN